MTLSEALQQTKSSVGQGLLWPALLVGSFLAAYTPTVLSLIDGPWQTEQEGHGPLIIAAALWLVWQSREKLKAALISPAPVLGWTALLAGLILMFLGRTQGVLPVEVLSVIPVITGCVLVSVAGPCCASWLSRSASCFLRFRRPIGQLTQQQCHSKCLSRIL